MTDDDRDWGDQADDAPIDFDRLDLIQERLHGDNRFTRSEWRPEYAPNTVTFRYEPGFYPGSVTAARLEIVWFENNDFSIHYHETHQNGSFDHRWDRHPSAHNAREHIHPGPDAPTPGEDFSFPADWRDVLSTVLTEIDDRQRGFWTA